MDAPLLTDPAFWQDAAPFVAAARGAELPVWVAGTEPAGQVLFQTSGSSGGPKWIALTKAAIRVSAAAANRHLEVGPASCWGLALPTCHVGGFGVVARAREAGCGLAVFGERWGAAEFSAWLARAGVTHTSLVPTQVHDLAAAGLAAPAGLRAVVVGGGKLPAATGRAARALGWPVLASFGMTEAGSQIATQGLAALDGPYVPAPIPLLDIWQARIGEPHECLEIAGPALFSGEWMKTADGRWTAIPRTGKWHATRDRVELAGRSLTPLGRADTQVKVLGELVDPLAIEDRLIELSGGILAGTFAVAALPDTRREHRLIPVFEGPPPAGWREWLAAYNNQVAGFLRLDPPQTLNRLPRGSLGKIRRAELARALTAE